MAGAAPEPALALAGATQVQHPSLTCHPVPTAVSVPPAVLNLRAASGELWDPLAGRQQVKGQSLTLAEPPQHRAGMGTAPHGLQPLLPSPHPLPPAKMPGSSSEPEVNIPVITVLPPACVAIQGEEIL